MVPAEMFRFCPRCAAPRPAENVGRIPLRCPACGLVFYFNPTVAAAACVMVAMSMVGLGIAEIARSAGLRRLRTEQADG